MTRQDRNTQERDARRSRRTEARRTRLRLEAEARKSGSADAGSSSSRGTSSVSAAERRFRRRRALIVGFSLVVFIALVAGLLRIRTYILRYTDLRLTDEGLIHAERYSDCIAVSGIDVSEHQGEDINWDRVKTCGVDFVFIRAGYRSVDDGTLHEDAYFAYNIKGAHDAGIMTGAYFYSQALTPEEAEEEAAFLLKLVRKHDIDLPLAIDFEIYPGGRLSQKIDAGELYAASLYHDIALAFCRKVEASGYESAIYANYDMFTHYMDASLIDEETSLWLAQYGTSADLEADYLFWQCGENSRVAGISGDVDHDIWYIEPGKTYPTRAGHKDNAASIDECTVTFSKDVYGLSLMRAKPEIEVTNVKGKRLKNGRDYTYSVIRNTEAGTGYVIIRGLRSYMGWMAVPFTIE